ncbi:alpha-E domain-containing protein [Portibacter lacus]|uniref:DUF403 domain-containing protein n=1 Tax=Portibacter lacus TaxID=1099794 RepID=A0AA37SRX6_9BACT|nr:alpha-E domain-containing protein [Portibacter lacus]GLR16955.1 hypothetical protein GCM10007940_15700 [Portibacter lacus]
MLARVAESLYWIGRNLERAEHCSRFLKVQYFSTLDSPMLSNRDFTLRSIMFMAGTNYQVQGELHEKDMWKNVIFDINNPNTIFSIIKNARENARSIRNSLSMEIWESINKLYLLCSSYEEYKFSSGALFKFSEEMKSNISVIKSNVTNTILQDDIYHFITMGIFVERSMQVLRIVRNKISDWVILSNDGENKALVSYQWTILLKSLEAFDIYNTLHPGKKSRETIFKLVFTNPLFPRSVDYSLSHLQKSIAAISVRPEGYDLLIKNLTDEMNAISLFDGFDDEDLVVQHVNENYERIAKIHNDLHNIYFK